MFLKRLFSRRQKNKVIEVSGKKKLRIFLTTVIFIFIAIIIGVVGVGFYNFNKITADSNGNNKASFFKHSVGDIPVGEINRDGDGRVNILLMGLRGSNDPQGGNLADTIMIASIDPTNKKMSLVSLPRDLYVKINGTNYGKLNSANNPGGTEGAKNIKSVVSNIVDLNIQNYIQVDFQGFKGIIDTMGGVEINVTKNIDDYNYPSAKGYGYEPLHIKAGLQTMNGDLALKYARSRESTSDFDRAKRQQQIITAVLKKASSIKTFSNPAKITSLMNQLGNNLRTDFTFNEITTAYSTMSDITSDNITNKVFDTSSDGPLTTTSAYGGYMIIPRLGLEKYTEIQEEAHKFFPEPYMLKENAKVLIAYSKTNIKTAQWLQQYLIDYGYNVVGISANESVKTKNQIIAVKDEPYSVSLLKNRLTADISTQKWTQTTPVADIVIIIGTSYKIPTGVTIQATPTH